MSAETSAVRGARASATSAALWAADETEVSTGRSYAARSAVPRMRAGSDTRRLVLAAAGLGPGTVVTPRHFQDSIHPGQP
jgi:hypothetical protein